MTTPLQDSKELSRSGPENKLSPALLRDGDGSSIIPHELLPGIDFGAHRKSSSQAEPVQEKSDRHQKLPEQRAIEEQKEDGDQGSYFAANPGEAPTIQPPQKTGTAPVQASSPFKHAMPAAKRMQTAPAYEMSRPAAPLRRSTLLRAFKHRPTMTQLSGSNRPQYAFDNMSDSTSDSSSEDGDMTWRQKRKIKKNKAQSKKANGEQDSGRDNKKRQKGSKKERSYSKFSVGNDHYRTKGHVSKRDGRLNIQVNETANSGYIAKALGQSIKHHLEIPHRHGKQRPHDDTSMKDVESVRHVVSSLRTASARPRLNIVIMVIGSRGDIQPFLKIGQILKHKYGHRVRIATHPTFRDFVEKEAKLEFFSVGGDPSELMAFMVKNPGLIPSLSTLREGEIHRRRVAMGEMFEGMWRACINTVDDEKDQLNLRMLGEKQPFVADAIIANPPSMAHVHIAEKLGIPLHIMFTFPYSPTQQFPHPLANITPGKSNVDTNYANFMSYPLVEMMTWQGLGDIVNRFRQNVLDLEPVSSLWAPGALYRMKVPYTYMWSPSLVPKPSDWGPEIDIAGFVFLDLANDFTPPQDLVDFLDAGEPPVYIGFGSIVVDDPESFTEMILEAVKKAGVRALVNKGWGGLGRDNENTPDNVYMLGNTPHDWLFPRVKAVVHHGGAGTTAIGLKCAKPTMIVPFFGDQPFWGARVAEAKAGAHECIPWKKLTVDRLAEGIKQCLTEEAQENVRKLAKSMEEEGDGAENAVESFHRSLPLAGRQNMRCSILDDRVAVWLLKGSSLRLSALAAEILLERRKIRTSDLKLLRVYEWNDFDGAGEPVTGIVGAMTDSIYEIGSGVGMMPVRIAKHIKKRQEHERRKEEFKRRKEERRQKKAAQAAAKTSETTSNVQGASNDAPRPVGDRARTQSTLHSVMSADPDEPLGMEVAGDIGRGFKRTGGALLTMPNDLHMAIAQGFHNAPRLWGDATVRKPVRITGVKSGLVAARNEFAYGIYDGFTGLVTQPVGGWQDADNVVAKVSGAGSGVAKGIGGFVLKNINAIIAPPAYFGKGCIVYIKKRTAGPGSKAFIRRAHLIRGAKDLQALKTQESSEKNEQLRRIQERVGEGWNTYKKIWDTAYEEYGAVGDGMVTRMKLRREKQRWRKSGALENSATAREALAAHQKGQNLDDIFSQRRQEVKLAEAPRASAMQQPLTHEDHPTILPNGQQIGASSADAEAKMQEEEEEEDDDDDDDAPAELQKVETTYADQEAEERKVGGDVDRVLSHASDDDESNSEKTVVADEPEEKELYAKPSDTIGGHLKGKGEDMARSALGGPHPITTLSRMTTA